MEKLTNWDRARKRLTYALDAWVKDQVPEGQEPNWYPDTWDLVFQIRDLLKEDE